MVDDSDSFIGIVTRKDIIRYFSNQRTSMEPALFAQNRVTLFLIQMKQEPEADHLVRFRFLFS